MLLGRGESGQIYGAETGGGGKDGKMGTRKEKKIGEDKDKRREMGRREQKSKHFGNNNRMRL